jgi:DNA (cytosine-5)-methyltransferase 1
MGYHIAGFDVFGVDIVAQPKYPFCYAIDDALDYLAKNGHKFDAIHASPPCQQYTSAGNEQRKKGKTYPDLVAKTRALLITVGKPWVIENVPGSPLINPIILCGTMFGLEIYRHRLFEASFDLEAPAHPEHIATQVKMGRAPKQGEFVQPVGHFSGVQIARDAMGIQWLGQKELAQAIPPAYTKFIGEQLVDCLTPI